MLKNKRKMSKVESRSVMKVLVTGHLGYIGTNFCQLLDKHDIVYDGVDILDGNDITSFDTLRRKYSFGDYTCVFHLAALKSVPDSNQRPIDYYETNVTGTINMLRAMDFMETSKCGMLVFSSTAAVYGDGEPPKMGFDEACPVKPCSVYGTTKAMAEQIIHDQCRTGKLRAVVLRYFNVYGGDYTDPDSKNLHSVIDMCKRSNTPLQIFGSDYSTRDGTAIRDYVPMATVLETQFLAMNYLKNNLDVSFEIFNIGTSHGKTVLEIAQENNVSFTFQPRRQGDPAVSLANCDKARRLLGLN